MLSLITLFFFNGFSVSTHQLDVLLLKTDNNLYQWEKTETLEFTLLHLSHKIRAELNEVLEWGVNHEFTDLKSFELFINGELVETEKYFYIYETVTNKGRKLTQFSPKYLEFKLLEKVKLVIHTITKEDFGHITYFNPQSELYTVKNVALNITIPTSASDDFFIKTIREKSLVEPQLTNENTIKYAVKMHDLEKIDPESYSHDYQENDYLITFGISKKTWQEAYTFNNFSEKLTECINDTNGLGRFLASLELDHLSPLEKIKKMYRIVQEQIQYAYVDLHTDGYIPSPISTVLFRKKGDCKDYTNLFIVALRAIGIEAYLVDVKTNDDFYPFDPSIKYLYQFDHAIVQVKLDRQTYYLDATASRFNIHEIRNDVQGMSANIYNDLTNEITSIQIPITPYNKNITTYTVQGSVAEKTLSGVIDIKYIGSTSQNPRNLLASLPSKKLFKRIERDLLRLNKNLVVKKIIPIQKDVFKDTVSFSVTFSLPNFLEDLGGINGFNLHFLENDSYSEIRKEKRRNDYIYTTAPKTIKFNYTISGLPKKISYLPENRVVENDLFATHFKATKAERMINYQFSYVRKKLFISKERADLVKDYFDQYVELKDEYITF
jgi:hypothetical protein